jgi:hypothetical protein
MRAETLMHIGCGIDDRRGEFEQLSARERDGLELHRRQDVGQRDAVRDGADDRETVAAAFDAQHAAERTGERTRKVCRARPDCLLGGE